LGISKFFCRKNHTNEEFTQNPVKTPKYLRSGTCCD